MKNHEIEDKKLAKKLARKRVSKPILWKLEEEHLDYLKLNQIEKLKYNVAKQKCQPEGKESSTMSFSTTLQSLTLTGKLILFTYLEGGNTKVKSCLQTIFMSRFIIDRGMMAAGQDDKWNAIIHETYEVVSTEIGKGTSFDTTLAKTLDVSGMYRVYEKFIHISFYQMI